MHIDAGIVTFNPDLSRLDENICAILPQVETVHIYDNGSDNYSDIEQLIKGKYNAQPIRLIRSQRNGGMAVALNNLAEAALADRKDAILLLDQDSVSTQGMVETLSLHLKNNIGITSPIAIDRNTEAFTGNNELPFETPTAITSGSLLSLKAYRDSNGYDESLFVDLVDFDFCLQLRLAGYSIVVVPAATLLHELGRQEFFCIFPTRSMGGGIQWKQYRTNHSSFRRYDMARSWAILLPKYHDTRFRSYVKSRMIKITVKAIVVERNRLDYIHQLRKGLRDGRAISQTAGCRKESR